MAINSCRQRGERKKKKRRNHCDVITPPITIKKTQHTHTHTHTHTGLVAKLDIQLVDVSQPNTCCLKEQ